MLYKSKRDGRVVGLALIVCVTMLGGMVAVVSAAFDAREPLLAIPAIFLAAVVAMLVWSWVAAWSAITPTTLDIGFGPFRWTIPLESIAEVRSVSRFIVRPAWGLAWSLDRIYIKCRNRPLPYCISPGDKPGFLAELQRMRPDATFNEG
jgi:hypothetical protein